MKTKFIASICLFYLLLQLAICPFIHEFKEAKKFINQLKEEGDLEQLQDIAVVLRIKCVTFNPSQFETLDYFQSISNFTIEEISKEVNKQLHNCRSTISPSIIKYYVREHSDILEMLRML